MTKTLDKNAVQEAYDEILLELSSDRDRNDTLEKKLASIQSSLGFVITVSGIATVFSASAPFDMWHSIVVLALCVSLIFLGVAVWRIAAASNPVGYQTRSTSSIKNALDLGKSKKDLQMEAIEDMLSMLAANPAITNRRFTHYRAAIQSLRKGVLCIAFAGIVIALGYLLAFFSAVYPHISEFMKFGGKT